MDSPQQALDALQREINLILEQTGRLFAAANQSTPEAALARASRLKQQLPVSNNRFHQALDVLDEKLQFTKLVMRRDLAVARSKSGTEAASKPTEVPASTNTEADKPKVGNAQPHESNLGQGATTAADQPQPESAKDDQLHPATSPKKRSSPSLEEDTSDEPAAKKQAVGGENSVSAEAPASDQKLELNTKSAELASGEQSAEDKAPDTGTFSNTGDLDSLFNDADSGGGMGGDNGDEPDFSTSADLNAEFDMASFTNGLDANKSNDNDNISALLPGLQDYANDTAGGEPDFSSFFSADPSTNPPDQSQNSNAAGGEQQNDAMQHDNTFDDIFDLTFDMGGGGNQSQNGGNDFDFDFS